jgi:hypothetical protein
VTTLPTPLIHTTNFDRSVLGVQDLSWLGGHITQHEYRDLRNKGIGMWAVCSLSVLFVVVRSGLSCFVFIRWCTRPK